MEHKVIVLNRRARYEYEILETYEAGMKLSGAEVKSLRAGKANLADAFCRVERGELWLKNAHITPYEKGSYFNSEAMRDRKLLMHAHEIAKLKAKAGQLGLSIVVLKLYFKGALIKAEIALARGKKLYDKRETIKKRDLDRQKNRQTY